MAPIVNGTVKGVLPDRRVFAVQYSGYPSSLERAVETLGGEAGISKVRSSEAGYLELRFRPEDPYSHPAFGEPHRTSDLLLRLSRPKNAEAASSQTAEETIDAEIVAQVQDSYAFDGLADYQYILAVHSDGTKDNKNKESKPCSEKEGLMDMGQEDLMILVPPLFSMKDMPEETLLRPSDRSKSKPADNTQVDFTPCFGLDFKAKDVPKAINWEDKLVKDSEEWCLHRAMVKCFEERPIWVRATLVQRLHEQNLEPTPSMLKRLLFRLAYNFLYGPFRTLWIRNGYDPRNDPESRRYQMLDFRVPRSLRYSVSPVAQKTADFAYWKEECAFKVVPQKKFSFFQLYDLEDDFIRSQIDKPPERPTCSESTGWFRRGTLERMRQQVRLRFLSLIPGDAARALEETEIKNFERFKNRSGWRGGNRGSHKAVQAADKGMEIDDPTDASGDATANSPESAQVDGNTKDSPIADDEDEDDEEEEEDEAKPEEDDDEEEDEEYEDDEDCHPQKESNQGDASADEPTSNHPSHDIPKNYLQALLVKFPLGSSGNQKAGEADDEGEYPIYEQDDEEDDY